MDPTGLNIAVVENKRRILDARVELVRRYFPGNEIFGYCCAQDLIEDLEAERHFFHVILSDVFMPPKGENLEEEGTWEDGASQIVKWLRRTRSADEHGDFEAVQLVLISRTNRQKTLPVELWSPDYMYWLQYLPDRSLESENWEFAEFRPMLYRAMIRAVPPPVPDQTTGEAITQSSQVRNVYAEARILASYSDHILIRGESGVGKELLARFIHRVSPRSRRPFVSVNCAAIGATLIDSELFGHRRGSFTGATNDRAGKFLEADKGTLFLDEIAEIPIDKQRSLNRPLQEGEIQPLGQDKERRVNVRVIGATSRKLETWIEEGKFDFDLFQRFGNVLTLPPLRECRDDIPILVRYFADKFSSECGKVPIRVVDDQALDDLTKREWPGNVRELEKCIRRAVQLSDTELIGRSLVQSTHSFASPSSTDEYPTEKNRYRNDKPSDDKIIEALGRYGSVTTAKSRLGVSRTMIYARGKSNPDLQAAIDSCQRAQRKKNSDVRAQLDSAFPLTKTVQDSDF